VGQSEVMLESVLGSIWAGRVSPGALEELFSGWYLCWLGCYFVGLDVRLESV